MKKYFLLLILAIPARMLAENIVVTSLAGLQAAIGNARPGDVIQLKNGVYTTTEDIVINRSGTRSQPITISAQQPGGVEITGSGGFNLVSPAAYVVITGFNFTHAASKARMGSGTSFCQWTRNTFETPGTGDYLQIAGSDHEVSFNTFKNKDSLGKFIAVKGAGSQIAERLWIHHNYFKTQKSMGGRNGAEALQFGLSGYSLSSSNSIVEYNLFEDCDGENELISVKASRVTVRYNTIRNCPAQFTLRHGNFNQVYGNYFINTPGLRIFGDDHLVHSIVGPAVNHKWEGNIIFNTNGAGDIPANGYRNIDPKLVKDAAGEYHLAAGSPAIDAATGNFAGVTTDMDDQPRAGKLDVGADEISKAPVKARILHPADVGHLAANKRS